MPWFQKLCRNLGRTVHNVVHPDGKPAQKKQTVRKTVEEQEFSDTVTLRRTTIEEVEVRQPGDPGL